MPEQEFYHTIQKPAMAEFKDRGSRFLAYAFLVQNTNETKEQLQTIKKEHPKANHHCFAYRIGLDGNNFRVSDDGEPSGTAGKPILNQIDSKHLINTMIVVVRYFGGTLLGVPGLINAYKTAASLALQLTPIIQKPVLISYHLSFDYTLMNDAMMIIKQYNCTIEQQELSMFCILQIGIPKSYLNDVLLRLHDIRSLEINKL
jgi:uncharacterized YigZ family protein